MFHEDWFGAPQCILLTEKAKLVEKLEGKIIEIGCWEGRSTVALANALYPQELIAVDTWQGNFDEQPDHITVLLARERDVFNEFKINIAECTKGNVISQRMDCFVFLGSLQDRIKFAHIDASHDYVSVKQALRMIIPKLITGGIICGDDYLTAHKDREDLQGGVQKAVMDMCPGHEVIDNFWWWIKK